MAANYIQFVTLRHVICYTERALSQGGAMATVPQQSRDLRSIPTHVKDDALVVSKRRQIVEAVVPLFYAQGFHQTTTRQMAAAAGMSVGALYEYVKSKEDVLYLVCEAIHEEMEARLHEDAAEAANARDALSQAIRGYFKACDTMQEGILLIYRETASLDAESRTHVLANETRIAEHFEAILARGREDGSLHLAESAIPLMAHNIAVLGHMWAFRRWSLQPRYTLEEYTLVQTGLIMKEVERD